MCREWLGTFAAEFTSEIEWIRYSNCLEEFEFDSLRFLNSNENYFSSCATFQVDHDVEACPEARISTNASHHSVSYSIIIKRT